MDAGYQLSASASGGTAGPSNASGSFFNSLGGFDGSGWNVNFAPAGNAGDVGSARASTPSVATPANVGFYADQYGLPNTVAVQSPTAAASAATTGSISPAVVLVGLVVLVLLARHHG
jgi:hypothetical protein